ncbi:hypothetical protein BC830DRAFT_130876 [Chytriomyces sp. MP71]|nr:hypothetical protein BC830DRAFT_130876 [Chytriomyces sp. MP71]
MNKSQSVLRKGEICCFFGHLGAGAFLTLNHPSELNMMCSLWSFSVATGRRIKKGEEWDTETTWHRVSAFTFADARLYASGQLGKGAQVLVEGRIRVRKDEESGRSYTDVVADKVDVIRPAAGPEDQH